MKADDSYHNWEADVGIIKGMGLNAYRFSISWPRILPRGRGEPNMLGVNYYNRLVYILYACIWQ